MNSALFRIHTTNIFPLFSHTCNQYSAQYLPSVSLKQQNNKDYEKTYRLSDADHNFLAFVGSVVDQTGDFLFLAFVFLQQTLGLGEFRREVSLHVFLFCSLNQAIKLSRTKHSSSQYRSMISRIIANLEKTKDSLSRY